MTKNPAIPILNAWLAEKSTVEMDPGNPKRISRNDIGVAITIFHHMRAHCPLPAHEAFSKGGEVAGSRTRAFRDMLEGYGIPGYLKEVTSRQAHVAGRKLLESLKFGEILLPFSGEVRERFILEAIECLIGRAREWFNTQNLEMRCDLQLSPSAWVECLLDEARGRSGGRVEQHLVGAKLEKRHAGKEIANYPGHAADKQTGRPGDFVVGSTCYHVTATPGSEVVSKCKNNLSGNLHPVLVVPRSQVGKAVHLAEDQGVANRITIVALEEFIGLNIIEMSEGNREKFIPVVGSIVEAYNKRLLDVETETSLQIELH